MGRNAILAVSLLALPALTWQAELPRDLLLLRDIKLRMRENLAHVPNYTCLETVARGRHGPPSLVVAVPGKSVPFRRIDTLRFEVAEVDGEELFAFPGNHDFSKMELSEIAPTGLMGSGSFSGFLNQIFNSDSPQFHFAGEEKLDGRPTIRYDFLVSQLESRYLVYTEWGRAIVGFHGSFWADPRTFDLIRLELFGDDIPPSLGIDFTGNRMEYAMVRIGVSNVLLPQSGEISMRRLDGWADRNSLTFTHCREYGVESTISFADVGDSAEATGGTRNVELPSSLELTISLEMHWFRDACGALKSIWRDGPTFW